MVDDAVGELTGCMGKKCKLQGESALNDAVGELERRMMSTIERVRR